MNIYRENCDKCSESPILIIVTGPAGNHIALCTLHSPQPAYEEFTVLIKSNDHLRKCDQPYIPIEGSKDDCFLCQENFEESKKDLFYPFTIKNTPLTTISDFHVPVVELESWICKSHSYYDAKNWVFGKNKMLSFESFR